MRTVFPKTTENHLENRHDPGSYTNGSVLNDSMGVRYSLICGARLIPVCMKEFSEESGKEAGGHMTSMGRPRKKDRKRE